MNPYVAGAIALGAYEMANQFCQLRLKVKNDLIKISAASAEVQSTCKLNILNQEPLYPIKYRPFFDRVKTFPYKDKEIYLNKNEHYLSLLQKVSIISRVYNAIYTPTNNTTTE
jgi:hypothetical protein